MLKNVLLTSAIMLTLTSCVGPTTYHAYDGRYGYQSIQLNNRLFEVRFSGNPATSQQAVHTMMLYRAAEITRQHGFNYFRVLSQHTDTQRHVSTTGGYSDTYFVKRKHGKEKITNYTPPRTFVTKSFASVIRFRLIQGGQGNHVYNARTLKQSLESQIVWPKPDQ